MNDTDDRLITLAIHTYEYAQSLKTLLENEGIEVELHNVNLSHPVVSAGIRVRIHEKDLPQALRVVENREIFTLPADPAEKIGDIVVPTDFTPHSFQAVPVAFRLAATHRIGIVFLHAYIDPSINSEIQLSDAYSFSQADEELSVQLLKERQAEMTRFTDTIKDKIKQGKLPAVKFSSVVTEGVPEEVINNYAKQHTPYMIVMGTRDAVRKEKDLIGSVSAEVLDSCRTTVITIPESGSRNDSLLSGRITMFCNLEQTDIVALDTLANIFSGEEAELVLIHIPSHRDRLRDTSKAMKALTVYAAANYPQFKIRSASSGLDRLMNSGEDMGLVVVANKKKHALARLFYPGVAHRLLFKTDVAMMAIPV